MKDTQDLAELEGVHCLHVERDEVARLRTLAQGLKGSPYRDLEGFFLEATLVFHQLPARLRAAVWRFKRFGNKEGVLLVRGLPGDPDLPSTPGNSERSGDKHTSVSELWLASFGTALGEPFAYAQEKEGEIFQNVCPTRHNEAEWSSESSRILLPFHTETAFHPHMPGYVLLYCLRPDHAGLAQTLIASVRRILPRLTAGQIEILRRAAFETGIDYSFGSTTGRRGGGPITPILYGDAQDPYFRYDPGLMKALDPEAAEVMPILDEIIDDVAVHVRLKEGDLCMIDNRRTVHARTDFVARYDGHDRWIQRLFVADTLVSSAEDRMDNGRVIATTFAAS